MHVHPAFRVDRTASLAFAAARGFGLVVAYDGARPVASPLPFLLAYRDDGTPVAAFHVTRGNPLAALAARGESWLLAIGGADAYVSADWYLSPQQVPTWLYEAVHLSGRARLVAATDTRTHLDRLTEHFEWPSGRPPAWTTARLTAGRREAMMQAIVVIEMVVEQVEGSAKLGQNKSDADFQALVRYLQAQHDPMARQISARMVALRPHLSYENAAKETSHG
jgi:transcriptional regulator